MASHEHAIFGNRGGSHQLLETSLGGEHSVLEELRFLVDRPAGHVGAEVVWSPYWGCSPVGRWWVLWRGEEDRSAPRRNMVTSRAVLVRQDVVGSIHALRDLVDHLSADSSEIDAVVMAGVADALAGGTRPVVVPGVTAAPLLLLSLWPRLWPAARARLSLRTLFGNEGLDPSHPPDIVVIPTELRHRWKGYAIVSDRPGQPVGIGASWLCGGTRMELDQLLEVNWNRLPSDISILIRLERIATSVQRLQEGTGQLADALLIARSVEAFEGACELPTGHREAVVACLTEMRDATIGDIRTASLAALSAVNEDIPSAEQATSSWIRKNLPREADDDAMWILEQQAADHHAAWWLRAVRAGLSASLRKPTGRWAAALWRWWSMNAAAVEWTKRFLRADSATESSLLATIPSDISNKDLETRILALCAEQNWARLLAGLIPATEPLELALRTLRELIREPEVGLDILLERRAPREVVAAASSCTWRPLVNRASRLTASDPALLAGIDSEAAGAAALIAAHLKAGGHVPEGSMHDALIHRVFDGCIDGEQECLDVLQHMDARASAAALGYGNLDALWESLGSARRASLLTATARAWLESFIAYQKMRKPGPVLGEAIQDRALATLGRGPIERVMSFFVLFREMSESDMVNWLGQEGFGWQVGDTQRLGSFLAERGWAVATKSFRYSWKSELREVAWHARSLLNYDHQAVTSPPEIAKVRDSLVESRVGERKTRMKILLLAANPSASARLGLDEEVRAIEEKLGIAKCRDAVEFCSKWATRPGDLQRALLEDEPTVVHFSGHGGGTEGIVLHSDAGTGECVVSSAALADLFAVLKANIRLVVLNACYSSEQARYIVDRIDCVVGMAEEIGDEGARVFAGAFYLGLAYGKSVQTAFDLGCNELRLMGLTEDEEVPVLLTREGVDASTVMLVKPESLSE